MSIANLKALEAEAVRRLRDDGIVWLEGIGTPEELLARMTTIGHIRSHPHATKEGVTIIDLARQGEAILEASARGFSARELRPHTDRATESVPPALLGFAILQPSREGGHSVFVDGRAVFRALRSERPAAAEVLSRPEAARFGPRPGVAMPIFERRGETIVFRYRNDALITFARDARPYRELLAETVSAFTSRRALGHGEGYIVNNGWYLHGRTAFSGERMAARVLADGRPELGIAAGFPL